MSVKPNFKVSPLHDFKNALTYTCAKDCIIIGSLSDNILTINNSPILYSTGYTPFEILLQAGDIVKLATAPAGSSQVKIWSII